MFTGLKIQYELSDPYLNTMLSKDHELVKLKEILDWKSINRIYQECYPSRRGPKTKSTDLAVGMILLKHYYNLSWDKLVSAVHENIAIMYFCSVSFNAVAKMRQNGKNLINSSTMIKIMKKLGPKRIQKIERLFYRQLKKAGIVDGKTLIVDTTSLEKNIAYPTEVNLLGRVIECSEKIIQKVGKKSKLVKSAVIRKYRQVAKVFYSAGRKTEKLLRQTSRTLLKIAKEQVVLAGKTYQACSKAVRKALINTHHKLTTVGEKILSQIEEKLEGGKPEDKIVNMNEPHVRALPKGKIHKPCEFGTKLRIDMSGNGYVTNYKNYIGNPNDATMLEEAVRVHAKGYGKKFKHVTADRGFANSELQQILEKDCHITTVIPGKQDSKQALSRKDRKIYDSRAAIEAKISEGKRCTGLDKCRYHGFEGDQISSALGSFGLNARKLIRDLREHPKLILKFG